MPINYTAGVLGCMSQEYEAEAEQPEADHKEVQAIVERIRRAGEPNLDGCDRESLWTIAREMKRMQDQLAVRHSDRPTMTVAEVRHGLDLAPPDALVVLHVGGSQTFGVVAAYPSAQASPIDGPSRAVVILTSSEVRTTHRNGG